MFFMIGVNQGRKDLAYDKMIICEHCGAYGRYQVFMTFMALSIFFIPCFRWNKRYYVQSTCCNTYYELEPQIGQAIARGEQVEILPRHLTMVQAGYRSRRKRCGNCGFVTEEDFEYCPKCGQRF